jgi:hypothetical protein
MKSNSFLRFLPLITRLSYLVICLVLVISTIQPELAVTAHTSFPSDINNNNYQVSGIANLWVDAASGNDGNDGLTPATAFRTIQKAADVAMPGNTVHILPGIYRESVRPRQSGSDVEPIVYRAESGPGSVIVRGSEPSSGFVWTPMTANTIGLPPGVDPTNIYFTDLSSLNLNGTPRFIVELDGNGQVVARMPLAREPDWNVVTDWKYQEYWWTADGGAYKETCDPTINHDCDQASRSTNQLTDQTNDTNPVGVEPGNLTTLGDLTGATLVAIDTVEGHYVYRRTITAHNIAAGTITVDNPCEFDSETGNPGLGWGSKYYVEGKPNLLDSPGEWWYDAITKRLYLLPRTPGNPASQNIEISQYGNGFDLHNRSYITLDGLSFEFFNENAINQVNWITDKSFGNTLRNLNLQYSNIGVNIMQGVSANEAQGNITNGFTLEDSEIANMDTLGVNLSQNWDGGSNPDLFTHSGVQNTTIRNNNFHDLGFRSDNDTAIGLGFLFADKLRFEGNYVHNIAHNGVQFSMSVIQSPKEYGFDPSEIKTGDILVKDNIFEKTCLLGSDCGGLKIWGSPPDNHVFRNFLIFGNIFRNNFGWSYISEMRQRWMGGVGSEVRGMGGFGLFLDYASGIHAYRNIAYNNAFAGYSIYEHWSDGDFVFVNNIAANSVYGMALGIEKKSPHDPVNTEIINNMFINNEGFGLYLNNVDSTFTNTTIDSNLYFNNGWQGGMWEAGVMVIQEGSSWNQYQTIARVQAYTPWEDHGLEDNPIFWEYNPADHELHDGSWPDFHLTSASGNAIDRGTTTLPASLSALLNEFGVPDFRFGSAFDIGRYEAGFLILATPTVSGVNPGNTVNYSLSLFPSDIPYSVNLSYANPSPDNLTLDLSTLEISGTQISSFTATDNHQAPVLPGEFFSIPITGVGGGFTNTTDLGLMVGGNQISLPLIGR